MDLSGDWSYINSIAKQRLENNRTPRQVDKYSYLEVLGAAGELAARRFLHLPEELHVHFDGGRDLRWNGCSVDVKTTIMTPYLKHRFLQWPIDKPIHCDLILLMAVHMKFKIAHAIGYATHDEVEASLVNHTREFPCREIPVPELHQAWELVTQALRPGE
jgi:hypothetical protein